ncbi:MULTISPECIES: IS5 family transposase [unclassified Streptomyces]|uniref:IS5 family transposase n=1 Tax=unclassified Streptomyces TaxID=2593676 RepID=UPI002366F0B4|nr:MULTISPECIES: IS5 family transposase [unclassified Streptomyces]MDF3142988.1 IS5 family transposase [Streptomyces sp. T21Q-yed]WDF44051.1 IS5 family transposase [Streptomyces sp. T12]
MGTVEQLVPDGLWEIFQDVAPEPPVRAQGGGRRRCDDRAVLAAIIFVATSGCTWRQLPPVFGASWQTVHRRFTGWSKARVWAKIAPRGAGSARHERRAGLVPVRNRLGQCPGSLRGPLTGPNPTDRGQLGSKIHVICDRNGLPISVGISGADLHDSQALIPLMRGIPPIRSRYGPRRRRPAKLHPDKGYDFDHLRDWLRRRQIAPCIARRGIEPPNRLGRHRWVVERTMSWLNGCRRLHRRYERKAEHFLAFVGIASSLICYRRCTN